MKKAELVRGCCEEVDDREMVEQQKRKEQELVRFLHGTLEDEEGRQLVMRLLQLAYRCFEASTPLTDLGDLPYLCSILAFFTTHLNDTPEYREILTGFCGMFLRPITASKSSLEQSSVEISSFLFTTLGKCLVLLKGEFTLQSLVIDIIFHVFEELKKVVPTDYVYDSARTSDLFNSLNCVLHEAERRIYNNVLELLLILCNYCSCTALFWSVGGADHILSRLTFDKVRKSIDEDTTRLTSKLLWTLFQSERQSAEVPHKPLALASMIILREWFRREVLYGRLVDRNNVATLILRVIVSGIGCDLAKSGIIQDLCLVAIAPDFGAPNTWAEGIKLSHSKYDLALRKILVTAVCYSLELPLTKIVARDCGFVTSLALMLAEGAAGTEVSSPELRKQLLTCSLYALPIAARRLPIEYTKSGATTELLRLIDMFSRRQVNPPLLKICCESLSTMTSSQLLHQHFRDMDVASTLIDLLAELTDSSQMTLMTQAVLEHSCHVLSDLLGSEDRLLLKHASRLLEVAVNILKRLQSPKKYDSKIENSLLILAGDFAWHCVVQNPHCRKEFISNKGIYMILDIMEDAIFPVKLLYLSILSDCCFDRHCVSQMITWRGKKVNTSVLRLLCQLWREQEARKGVLRSPDGIIEDIEWSMMGGNQRSIDVRNFATIPSLVEMLGCARPKIAIIFHQIKKKFADHAWLAKSVYLVPYDALPIQDQITLEVIRYYEVLKEGEMFWEIKKAAEATNTDFMPLDRVVVHDLAMRHVGWAHKVKVRQLELVSARERRLLQDERELYDGIRDMVMTRTLETAQSLGNYLSLTDLKYRDVLVEERERLLESVDERIRLSNLGYYHKTFVHHLDMTVNKSERKFVVSYSEIVQRK